MRARSCAASLESPGRLAGGSRKGVVRRDPIGWRVWLMPWKSTEGQKKRQLYSQKNRQKTDKKDRTQI